eukprot:jgi/Astpho2/4818/Aster-x0215
MLDILTWPFEPPSSFEQGQSFLNNPRPLELSVAAEMVAEERSKAQAEAEAQRRQDQLQLLQSKQDRTRSEEQRLFQHLTGLRKDVAAGVGQAPINICADSVLLQLARMRPGSVAALSAVDGCTAVFREQHGQTFVDAIFNFCQDSPLTVGGEWLSTGRGAGTAARLPKSSPRPSVIPEGSWDVGALSYILQEPKGKAKERHELFSQGQSLSDIALATAQVAGKPPTAGTVASGIADMGAAGYSVDWARLAAEASVGEAADLTQPGVLQRCINAINGNRQLRAAKDAADVSYGQLHVAAAMLHVGAVQPPGEDEVFMDLSRDAAVPADNAMEQGEDVDPLLDAELDRVELQMTARKGSGTPAAASPGFVLCYMAGKHASLPLPAQAPVASGVFSPAAGSPPEQGFMGTPLSGQAASISSTDPGFADRSNTLPTTGGGSGEGRGKSRLSSVQGGRGSDAAEVQPDEQEAASQPRSIGAAAVVNRTRSADTPAELLREGLLQLLRTSQQGMTAPAMLAHLKLPAEQQARLKPLLQQMTNDMDILRLGPNATNSDQIDLTDDTVYRAF